MANVTLCDLFLMMWWTFGNIKHLTIYTQEEKKSHFSCQIWHFMCYVRLTCPQDHCLFDWARCVVSLSFLFFNTLYSENFSFWRSYYEIFSCLLEIIRSIIRSLIRSICEFNRDLNRGCLVYMFSLRFSGSKFFEVTCHTFPRIS